MIPFPDLLKEIDLPTQLSLASGGEFLPRGVGVREVVGGRTDLLSQLYSLLSLQCLALHSMPRELLLFQVQLECHLLQEAFLYISRLK